MIEFILSSIWPYLLAVGVTIIAVVRAYTSGKKVGRNEKDVENAKKRNADLERIKSADRARPSVGVQDDPNNRDRK